jgi:hypothetical protein
MDEIRARNLQKPRQKVEPSGVTYQILLSILLWSAMEPQRQIIKYSATKKEFSHALERSQKPEAGT